MPITHTTGATSSSTKKVCVDSMVSSIRRIREGQRDFAKYVREGKEDLADATIERLVKLNQRKEGKQQLIDELGLTAYVAAAVERENL